MNFVYQVSEEEREKKQEEYLIKRAIEARERSKDIVRKLFSLGNITIILLMVFPLTAIRIDIAVVIGIEAALIMVAFYIFVDKIVSIDPVLGLFVSGGILGVTVFIVTFSVAVYYAALPTIQPNPILSESSIQKQLNEVQSLSRHNLSAIESLKHLTTVHPYILENRLFIYINNFESSTQIEIPQKLYTSFFERTKINLGFNIKIDHSQILADKTTLIQDIIIKSNKMFPQNGSVLIADGSLQNLNYQEIFKEQIVFRSSSLDRKLITNNLEALSQSPPINPQNTLILNGIPSNSEELGKIGLDESAWKAWEGIQGNWQQIINKHGYQNESGNTAQNAIDAFKNKANVLVVIAHSDGQTIYFPDGTSLNASDIKEIKKEINQNRPLVALFSCETAKTINNIVPFSEALIQAGAKAVIAPVSEIGAKTTSELLENILRHSSENNRPIESLWKAIKDTDIRVLENWIGYQFELPELLQNLQKHHLVGQTLMG